MRKIIILLLFTLIGCNSYNEYSLYPVKYIPEEDKQKFTQGVSDIVKSATATLKTEDYEDVDDTISEATQTMNNIYSKQKIQLKIIQSKSDGNIDVYYLDKELLSQHQLEIYNKLVETNKIIREDF